MPRRGACDIDICPSPMATKIVISESPPYFLDLDVPRSGRPVGRKVCRPYPGSAREVGGREVGTGHAVVAMTAPRGAHEPSLVYTRPAFARHRTQVGAFVLQIWHGAQCGDHPPP